MSEIDVIQRFIDRLQSHGYAVDFVMHPDGDPTLRITHRTEPESVVSVALFGSGGSSRDLYSHMSDRDYQDCRDAGRVI